MLKLTNNMKVIIKIAGQQFLISQGDEIKINKKIESGQKIKIEEVLLLINEDSIEVGKPTIKVNVELESIETKRGKKVRVYKYKAKKGYRRNKSHRQDQSTLKVNKIT